ncbi:MAG: symmetrical bis(5'-nucleosyl)-tetraphosphatase [bacterium]|nr:symmetrical bis(5'-nucleosyl)-tetraphosphatase [bacterium]
MGATYVIGDIHGCFDTLRALWPRLGFDLDRDRLWLVGDLVNRGPRSLAVLRWAKELDERLGERMRVVLGNHDLHLLAFADGHARKRKKDTLDEVMAAPDRDDLVSWLASRQLVHRRGDVLLVHAGLLPHWTPGEAERLAREIEPCLRDPESRRPLIDRSLEIPPGDRWYAPRQALSAMAGLRTCTTEGEPCKFKGPPHLAPTGCLPWFQIPGRRSAGVTVVFGHWAAMGSRIEPGVIGLDSGCVWGNRLTAIRLEDGQMFEQETVETSLPANTAPKKKD